MPNNIYMNVLETCIQRCKSAERWDFYMSLDFNLLTCDATFHPSADAFFNVHPYKLSCYHFTCETNSGVKIQWNAVKICCWCCSGTYEHLCTVEISHYIWLGEDDSSTNRNLRYDEFCSLESSSLFSWSTTICWRSIVSEVCKSFEVDARKGVCQRISWVCDMSNIRRVLRDEIEVAYFSRRIAICFCFKSLPRGLWSM